MKTAVIAIVVTALSGLAAHAQDLAAGENSFKKCLPCHAVGEGAKNKVGLGPGTPCEPPSRSTCVPPMAQL